MMKLVERAATGAQRSPDFRYLREFPLVGSLSDFNNDRLRLFERLARHGDVYGMHLGPYPVIQFNRPEHVHSILVDHANDFDKGSANHRTFRPVIGNGILCSEGDFHDRQRKAMAPSFQPRRVGDYADTMAEYAEDVQRGWVDGSTIDVHQEMMDLSMRMIGKALFDADFFSDTHELGAALLMVAKHIAHSLTTIFPLPYSWPLPRNERTREAMGVLKRGIQRLIDLRRREPKDAVDFLTLLLQARDPGGRPMSDEQVMAECLTLFGAGQEPPASALTWVWYLLGHDAEVYEKVRAEVDTVLQGRTPRFDDLPGLPYCLQVFKEALRLYPPAYMIARRARRDLEIGGHPVAKGTIVMTNPHTLHRREEYFPDPERFDPERFGSERERSIPRYGYLPFGAGPRICIGQHYALMVGHIGVATLAQRVKFSLVPDQVVERDPYRSPSLRPAGAVYVRVRRR